MTNHRSDAKAFTCPMCGKPINLDIDETTDENGQVMHTECYLKRIGHGHTPPDDHHTE
jgi:hypothetical protein